MKIDNQNTTKILYIQLFKNIYRDMNIKLYGYFCVLEDPMPIIKIIS